MVIELTFATSFAKGLGEGVTGISIYRLRCGTLLVSRKAVSANVFFAVIVVGAAFGNTIFLAVARPVTVLLTFATLTEAFGESVAMGRRGTSSAYFRRLLFMVFESFVGLCGSFDRNYK